MSTMQEDWIQLEREIDFESVNQDRYLKFSFIYRYADQAGTRWWHDRAGMTHSDYFRQYSLGAVITYLNARVNPVTLMPQEPLTVRFQTDLGVFPLGAPDRLRYGGKDRIEIVGGRSGKVAATLLSHWLWFHIPREGKPGTIAEPPPLFPTEQQQFEADPPAPEVRGDRINEFRWTQRETDLNQHVNSIAYGERAENALADAGLSSPAAGSIAIWYRRPGFRGQRFESYLQNNGEITDVRLHNVEKNETSALIRLTGI